MSSPDRLLLYYPPKTVNTDGNLYLFIQMNQPFVELEGGSNPPPDTGWLFFGHQREVWGQFTGQLLWNLKTKVLIEQKRWRLDRVHVYHCGRYLLPPWCRAFWAPADTAPDGPPETGASASELWCWWSGPSLGTWGCLDLQSAHRGSNQGSLMEINVLFAK